MKSDTVYIYFTKSEIETLRFYMEKAKIDVEGDYAIGVASRKSVDNVNNILKRINKVANI